jgi:hypothetical protein
MIDLYRLIQNADTWNFLLRRSCVHASSNQSQGRAASAAGARDQQHQDEEEEEEEEAQNKGRKEGRKKKFSSLLCSGPRRRRPWHLAGQTPCSTLLFAVGRFMQSGTATRTTGKIKIECGRGDPATLTGINIYGGPSTVYT